MWGCRLSAAALACVLALDNSAAFTQSQGAFLSNANKNSNFAKLPFQHASSIRTETTLFSTLEESKASSSIDTGVKSMEDYVRERGGDRPIKKVLIANNGMAATKSIMSMRQWAYMELGDERAVTFVAMATPEDLKANAEFVRLADSFVEVPAGKNLNNYANVEVITRIAQEQNVDAVWPGWGHASENPKLPNTLKEMGIKFIGPTAPVMSVLGDKIAANILAQTAQVPSIPWSGSYGGPNDGPLQAELNEEGTIPQEIFEKATCRSVEEAVEAAKRIGYENGIMIKASEGGGGKGIRFVDNEDDLKNAYIQVQNEVIGSPIFLMQLCKNARHLEVQIVGDEHGNAIALNGRDCSTQRRFQKIFEEGPPTIAKRETFKQMELAAQRLTQQIGYVGAGTVEYLYNADTDKFFFLELNPRLQVEHPVTEGITGVNLPATQLQVAMGIPLFNIPEIRRFYGKSDVYGTSPIDFIEEDYPDINSHVIAARITAENPDEGFKPTSGSIERIKFQSTSSVWGYFSVGANGGIHEFADSQFGHLFAKGATREQARKALILALKEIEVRGEIRTTVEYLVQLLETPAFIENTIDTSWLDGIIREKSVSVDMPEHLTVTSAAIFKAFQHVQDTTEEVKESFRKGQTSVSGIPSINSFNIEVAYKDIKYPFRVERIAADVYRLSCGESTIDAQVTLTAEGALLATFGGETHRIFGMDEPLGLRLVLDGNTILMPTIFDPSELRTDVTGKVVRYLQESGAAVENGQPYVEVEAMKMIMPIKATESGKIVHNLSPGSVISAGDLLATLELKDPSKVKKIVEFKGKLDVPEVSLAPDARKEIQNILNGYSGDPDATTQAAFNDLATIDDASALVSETLSEFLRVEQLFVGKLRDDVVRELTKSNSANLDVVIAENQAKLKLKNRLQLVLAMLRQVETFVDRFGVAQLPEGLMTVLAPIAALKDKDYGEVALAADDIIRLSKIRPFDDRLDELRSQLADGSSDLEKLARSPTLSAGVDLLTALFTDSDITVREAAFEVYIRRVYRAHRVLNLKVSDKGGRTTCTFTFQFADTAQSKAPVRSGILSVVPSIAGLKSDLAAILDDLSQAVGERPTYVDGSPLNMVHVAVSDLEGTSPQELSSLFKTMMGSLKAHLAPRLLKLRVDEVEVKLRVKSKDAEGNDVIQNVRLVASSMDGEWLKANAYLEVPNPITGVTTEFCLMDDSGNANMCMLDPYGTSNIVQTKRAVARRVGSTYAYDFLGLMEVGLFGEWEEYISQLPEGSNVKMPFDLFEARELIEDTDGHLAPGSRPVGTNKVGMVSWLVNMKSPEYPEGREIVVTANDVTVQSGSFGVEEDEHYYKASVYARERKIPRIYIACNAGARIGLVDELKEKLQIKFVDASNPSKGFEYLYLTDEDYQNLPQGTVIANKVSEGWALTDVIGTKHGIGVENLQGSGKIAGETSQAYDEIFTLSYVTGRSVGIGAYLVRLGQRVIQMKNGPIILTGYSALNKLLGRDVYTSQDQLGGPQIMYPNGVAHDIVEDDQGGVAAILKWLSCVPRKVGELPACRLSGDPIDRPVAFRPTPTPYDPRNMLAGTTDAAGFFDTGSFKEYLSGWGKSVVIGRGRLGGIPMGAIAVETRLVDKVIPADPADPNSREAILPQAGQVLFPDSSYKVAQALRDFDKEGLPVMIFANWRGFSGGSRDMAGEILKFGAMIVDALREYSNPVYMYIPPHGELRGGSWVVVDPTINEDKMEMYADFDARGGILEPAGITEIKFRFPDQVKVMHRLDSELKLLDQELDMAELEEDRAAIKKQISAREESLKPVYLQAATEFADLHDKTGRMKAKGVIREAVAWESSREYFFWRAKRRMFEDDYVSQLKAGDSTLNRTSALEVLKSLYSGDWEDNKAVGTWYETSSEVINEKVKSVKAKGVQARISALQKELDSLEFM
ncbi:hypothetical protein MPSEU_000586300 [Mayamaea pseudoterrestris]|nr:hypothetical protein MPSEU_000586300 [Mayamaea pseudoterrestris]